jgi:hypothetical protein
MILKAASIAGVDFATFQDEFDLDKDIAQTKQPARNNFDSVAAAVNKKYPHVIFKRLGFRKGEGQKKVQKIEEMIQGKRPVLISLALEPFGGQGWHIVPVVDSDSDTFTLLWIVFSNGQCETKKIKKALVAEVHEKFDGGDDIAILEH